MPFDVFGRGGYTFFFFGSGGWRSGGSAGVKFFLSFFSSDNSKVSVLNS